jgi:hypothetical protein
VKIYVWSNGAWIYDWEVHGFTMKHSATLDGGRWLDLDKLHGLHLTPEEKQAVVEALGGE